ncbi:ATP-binding protein [Pigmentiphaga sp. CHJ604]|uniref:sensor histidine kinase n=1 Tax=Pigmentiphaga sp. CHJ604 TaxID=3081984 RepID=UPI0030CC3761
MPHQEHLPETGGHVPHARDPRSTFAWLAVVLALWLWLPETARADACRPAISSISAARANESPDTPPATGWEAVALPDIWSTRWPGHDGTVWYRVEWTHCPGQPVALFLEYLSMAGAGRLNDDPLWADASLVEPLTRSWNLPRYSLLPPSALRAGINTLWIRVAGYDLYSSGLGGVHIGPPDEVRPRYEREWLLRRVLPQANLIISITLGCFFLMVWLLRRNEQAYGWYALTSLAWLLFGLNSAVTSPWPFATTHGWSTWITLVFTIYCSAFSMFAWRFGGQRFPRLEKALWTVTGAVCAALLALGPAQPKAVFYLVAVGYAAVFVGTCVQFQFRAARTRQPEHLFLAACMLGFLVAAIHDILAFLRIIDDVHGYTAATAPLIMIGMALVLAWSFTSTLGRVERFNRELADHVEEARRELAHTLGRQHELEVANARLSERLRISHDLHDGLGSSLVRSIVMAEKGDATLPPQHYVSVLKSLRDDLRQVLDHSFAAVAATAASPADWIAPLRRRFGDLFDDQGVRCVWRVAPEWPAEPDTARLLALARFLEEALTNVIKHSRANTVAVTLADAGNGALELSVEDDGAGFDVELADRSMVGIGLRSMRARIARIGGRLAVESGMGGTRLRAHLPAAAP